MRPELVRNGTRTPAAAGLSPTGAGLRAASNQELSATHLSTELFLAAPASGLPSLLTAAVSQHFLIADVLAAPARGLPSLLIASFLHDCASAGLTLIGERNAVAVMKHTSVAAVVRVLLIGVSFCATGVGQRRTAELTSRIGPGKPSGGRRCFVLHDLIHNFPLPRPGARAASRMRFARSHALLHDCMVR